MKKNKILFIICVIILFFSMMRLFYFTFLYCFITTDFANNFINNRYKKHLSKKDYSTYQYFFVTNLYAKYLEKYHLLQAVDPLVSYYIISINVDENSFLIVNQNGGEEMSLTKNYHQIENQKFFLHYEKGKLLNFHLISNKGKKTNKITCDFNHSKHNIFFESDENNCAIRIVILKKSQK